jgi:hypothetical protein
MKLYNTIKIIISFIVIILMFYYIADIFKLLKHNQ